MTAVGTRVHNAQLKRERERRGWTQKDVAKRIGTDPFTICRWERGVTHPNPRHRQELCRLFGMTSQELGLIVPGSAAPPTPPPLGGFPPSPAPPSAPTLPDRLAVQPLPAPSQRLVGRDHLLRTLRERLSAGTSVALCALNGLPGVGKTALAVALASDLEVTEHFSDGIIWAPLGPTPNAAGLLGGWGAAFGMDASELSRLTSIDAQAQAVSRAIGLRRMLIVIDDAWTVSEATAVKVGGPNCAHILTTRFPEIARRFAGDGAIVVRELSEEDGLALLRQMAPDPVLAEPDEARDLVRSVGGLPLALTLIGKHLQVQTHSGQPRRLRSALSRLRRAEERLQLEEPFAPVERPPGLPRATPLSLRASIAVSDRYLDKAASQALRALSVFPAKPNSFSEEAARVICRAPVGALDRLVDAGLLEAGGSGRYLLHQTIADYAQLSFTAAAARERLAAFYAAFLQTHAADYNLLDIELGNILAALDAARETRLLPLLVSSATAVAPFLEARGLYTIAESLLTQARASASELGDTIHLIGAQLHLGRIAELRGDLAGADRMYGEGLQEARTHHDRGAVVALLTRRGEVAFNRGRYDQAEAYLREALDLATQAGDTHRRAAILRVLGEANDSQGHFARADELYLEALALARAIGDREIMSACLQDLGAKAAKRGEGELAVSYLEEGLALVREIRHWQRISALLANLGAIAIWQGRYVEAEAYLQESLDLARQIGNRVRICNALQNLGVLEGRRGRYQVAREHLEESLAIARDMEHRWLISETLGEYGNLHLTQGHLAEAWAIFAEALATAQEVGAHELIALAHLGLGRVAAAEGRYEEARAQGEESLHLLTAQGHGKVAELVEWLAALPSPGE